MEYGGILWHPHQQTRIKTLEAVHNKGARYVNQDWDRHKSVITMKKDLGWLTLQERRLVNRKLHHCTNIRARTDAHKFSFLPRSIRAWNSLPPEIIAIQTTDTYRNAIATALRKGTIEMTNGSASSNNYQARTDIP